MDEFSFSIYSTPINIPLLLIIIITNGMLYLVAVSISNPEKPNALSPTIAKTYFSGWTNFAAIAYAIPKPIGANVPVSNLCRGYSC